MIIKPRVDLAAVDERPQPTAIPGNVSGLLLGKSRAEQIHGKAQLPDQFILRGMACPGDHPAEGLNVFFLKRVELAYQNVDRVGHDDRAVADLVGARAFEPIRAGPEAHPRTYLKAEIRLPFPEARLSRA